MQVRREVNNQFEVIFKGSKRACLEYIKETIVRNNYKDLSDIKYADGTIGIKCLSVYETVKIFSIIK